MKSKKLVYGVGVNDSATSIATYSKIEGKRVQTWTCPFYSVWSGILYRCYGSSKRQGCYESSNVCDEWLVFSNFRNWMEKQNWKGMQLDKDLLTVGNVKYSPSTCIFVHPIVNKFPQDSSWRDSNKLIGCYLSKDNGKYRALCQNPFTNKQEHLGYYLTELQAHLAWKTRKHELACMLAESEYVDDPRVAEALRTRYL